MPEEEYFVIYDGDCGFCEKTVSIIKSLDWFSKLRFLPFQQEGILLKFNELTKEKCEKEIYLLKKHDKGYKYYAGYDAFKIMTVLLPSTFLISPFFFLPGVVQVGRIIYRKIAENRHKISIGNKACKIKD